MTRALLAALLLAGIAACSGPADEARQNNPARTAATGDTEANAGPADAAQLAALRRKAAASPNDPGAEAALIAALLSNGLGEEALQRARALQSRTPGSAEAHRLVGDARGLHGDFRGAAEEYDKAAKLAFDEPVALRLIEALTRSGQGPAADRVLARLLQQRPSSVAAQRLAASRATAAERWDEAISRYEALRARLGDEDALLLNNLAWAYLERGNMAAALPLAERAWGLDPGNPAMADTYGWLLFRSGRDRAKGLALLEQAAHAAPGNADIRHRLEEARGG